MKATHNIVHAENYTSNGEEKTRWHNIGVVLTGEKNGKKRTVIKLNIPPFQLVNDGFFNVFPIDENRGKTAVDEAKDAVNGEDTVDVEDLGGEPISLEDIPF